MEQGISHIRHVISSKSIHFVMIFFERKARLTDVVKSSHKTKIYEIFSAIIFEKVI